MSISSDDVDLIFDSDDSSDSYVHSFNNADFEHEILLLQQRELESDSDSDDDDDMILEQSEEDEESMDSESEEDTADGADDESVLDAVDVVIEDEYNEGETYAGAYNEIEIYAEGYNEAEAYDDDDAATEIYELPDLKPKEDKQESTQVKKKNDTTLDEDGQMCTICFEPWTSSGEHRLVSLKCGHLFGQSCISRWLSHQGAKCPQCNAVASKKEVRPIFARCVKMLDTTERDGALRNLQKETEVRKKTELELAQMRIKHQMVVNENELLKKQLMETQFLLNESRSNVKKNLDSASSSCKPIFTLSSKVELKACRVMESNDLLGIMVLTQTSTNPLFPGYGLRKISLPEMKCCEYVHLHQKPIKDISFHAHNGLVLTASLDKTLKLTNCLNNSSVQMYTLDCEVWSCAWDMDDSYYFFAGMRNGAVYVFDIRMTDRHIERLANHDNGPVVSMQYIKRQSSLPLSGILVGQLGSSSFYRKKESVLYEVNQMPLEGRFTSLCYDSMSSHLLASFRPSSKHPQVTHTLCEIAMEDDTLRCNLVQSMLGGNTQVQLARSKLVQHPSVDSDVLVCAGDEESKAALIWNGCTGKLLDTLKSDSPVLDLISLKNGRSSFLGTLTEKDLRLYKWTGD